jgi:Fic family protein
MSWGKNGEPLTTVIFLKAHNDVLMRGATTSAGKEAFEYRFRSHDQPFFAGFYTFPNMTNHEEDLAEALRQRETDFEPSHPVAYATNLLYDVLSLHPYMNGNGRTARLLYA